MQLCHHLQGLDDDVISLTAGVSKGAAPLGICGKDICPGIDELNHTLFFSAVNGGEECGICGITGMAGGTHDE